MPVCACLRVSPALQAVSYLVKESTGRDATTAQYAISRHTWSQSAVDAMTSSSALYSLLGPGGNQTWDYVILQACSPSMYNLLLPTYKISCQYH